MTHTAVTLLSQVVVDLASALITTNTEDKGQDLATLEKNLAEDHPDVPGLVGARMASHFSFLLLAFEVPHWHINPVAHTCPQPSCILKRCQRATQPTLPCADLSLLRSLTRC